jgi:NAD-dependent deacetylase
VEDVCTPQALARDPELVHRFYDLRRAALATVEPNAAHRALARLDAAWAGELLIVTQNVDDLHERAGSDDVVHLHGSLFASRCLDCGHTTAPDPILDGLETLTEGARESPPPCPACGGPFRPGVVWFGEALPDAAWDQACAAMEDCDLLVIVGTSGLVHPAATLPQLARTAGARTVEINPAGSAVSALAHESLRLGASAGIRLLLDRLG